MANESHPKLGTLSEEEIKLVEKHRADQHKLSGWRQCSRAMLDAFDNFKSDGSLSPPMERQHLRAALARAAENYKIY